MSNWRWLLSLFYDIDLSYCVIRSLLRSPLHWSVLAVGLSCRWWRGGGGGVEGVAPSPLSVSRWGSFISSLVQRSVCPQQSTASDNPRHTLGPSLLSTCVFFHQTAVIRLLELCWNLDCLSFRFSRYPLPVRLSVTNGSNNRPDASWSLSAFYCKSLCHFI